MRIVSLLLLAGCVTPYQPMGAMGGYEDQPIGNGQTAIHVRGNGYTDIGTVLQYAYRRANELCPSGYDIVDRGGDSTRSMFDGNVRSNVTVIVKCRFEKSAPSQDDQSEKPPVIGDASLWCTDGPAVKVCFSSVQRCEGYRTDRSRPGEVPAACTEHTQGACFNYVSLTTNERLALCSTSEIDCEMLFNQMRDSPDIKVTSRRCNLYYQRVQLPSDAPAPIGSDGSVE